ncbi:hypothetical protein ACMFMG_005638 [Clarireedia jacksonii]
MRLPSICEAKEPVETNDTTIIHRDSPLHVNGDTYASSGGALSSSEDDAESQRARQIHAGIDAISSDSPFTTIPVDKHHSKPQFNSVKSNDKLDRGNIAPPVHIHSVPSKYSTENQNDSEDWPQARMKLSSSSYVYSDQPSTELAPDITYTRPSERINAQTHSDTSLVNNPEHLIIKNAFGEAKYVHRMSVSSDYGMIGHTAYDHMEKIKPSRLNTSRIGKKGVYVVPKVYLPNGIGHIRTVSEPMVDVNESNGESIETVRGLKIGRIPPKARVPSGAFSPSSSPSNGVGQRSASAVRSPPPMNRPYRRPFQQNINGIPSTIPRASSIQVVSSEPAMPSTGAYHISSNVPLASNHSGSTSIIIANPPMSPPHTPPSPLSLSANPTTKTTRITLPFADRRPEAPPNRFHSPAPSQTATILPATLISSSCTSLPHPPALATVSPTPTPPTRTSQSSLENDLLTEHLRREGLLSQIIFPSSTYPPSPAILSSSPHLTKDHQRKRKRYFIRPDLRRGTKAKRNVFKKAKILLKEVRTGIKRNRGKVSYLRIRIMFQGLGRRLSAWGRRAGKLEAERKVNVVEGMEFMCRGTWDQRVGE